MGFCIGQTLTFGQRILVLLVFLGIFWVQVFIVFCAPKPIPYMDGMGEVIEFLDDMMSCRVFSDVFVDANVFFSLVM